MIVGTHVRYMRIPYFSQSEFQLVAPSMYARTCTMRMFSLVSPTMSMINVFGFEADLPHTPLRPTLKAPTSPTRSKSGRKSHIEF